MTTYKTGNPVPSTNVRDLFDNTENLDEAVNTTSATWIDRLGNVRLSMAGMSSAAGDATIAIEAAQDALDASQNATQQALRAQAAADAATISGNVFPNTADGIAGTANGEYFSVPSADTDGFLDLYFHNAGSAVYVDTYPNKNALAATRKNGFVFTGKITKAVFNHVTSAWTISHTRIQFDLGAGKGFVRVAAASDVVVPNGRALIADLRSADGASGPTITGEVTAYDISSLNNGLGAFVDDLRIPLFVNRVADGATNKGGLLAERRIDYGNGQVWFKSAASTSVSYDDATRELSWNGGIFCPMLINGSTRINLLAQTVTIPDANYQTVWLDLSQVPTPNGDFPSAAIKVGGYNETTDNAFKNLPHQLPIFYRERAGVYAGVRGFPVGASSSGGSSEFGLEFQKSTNLVRLYFNGAGANKIEVPFTREIVPFDGTSPNSQLDNWRLAGGWETSAEYVRGNQIINTGEWEMALRISGDSDSVGGYHGDELQHDMLFLVDGVPLSQTATVSLRGAREVQALQNSYVFDENVEAIIDAGTGLPTNAIAKHSKRYYFTAEGIRIVQRLEWLQDRSLVSAWVAMLPILRNRDTTSGPLITDAGIRSRLFEVEDLSTWDDLEPVAYTPVQDGDSVTLWGATSGISGKVQFTRTPNLPNQKVYISTNTSAYNKVYFNLRGDATTGDPLISASTGDVWEWESFYQINTAN